MIPRSSTKRKCPIFVIGSFRLVMFARESHPHEIMDSMENVKLKGVNLGGWLVLERWITPNFFNGTDASDERSLMLGLGPTEAKKRLETHRRSFVTEKDFLWLSQHGFNAVRVPVGYWVFEDQEPFISAKPFLDRAMQWAEEHGLKVLLDLHASPGSQNSWNHSGDSRGLSWHTSDENIEKTIEVVQELAKRYKDSLNLWGIGVLNEPRWDVPLGILIEYYLKAYRVIRDNTPSRVQVIFSDGFRPIEVTEALKSHDLNNVMLDMHLYQLFNEDDKQLSFEEHITKTNVKWKRLIAETTAKMPMIVGEWSAALDSKTFEGMDDNAKREAYSAYYEAQCHTFENAAGWFYWTYKTERPGPWNLRSMYDKATISNVE